MNLKYNGVRCLCSSSRSHLIYVGGDDGSLYVLSHQAPAFTKPVSSGRTFEASAQEFEYDAIAVKDYNTVREDEIKIAKVIRLLRLKNVSSCAKREWTS